MALLVNGVPTDHSRPYSIWVSYMRLHCCRPNNECTQQRLHAPLLYYIGYVSTSLYIYDGAVAVSRAIRPTNCLDVQYTDALASGRAGRPCLYIFSLFFLCFRPIFFSTFFLTDCLFT